MTSNWVKECADGLQAHCDNMFPAGDRPRYPTLQRSYDRDMKPVLAALAKAGVK